MGRGILSGMIWGTLLSGSVMAFASLNYGTVQLKGSTMMTPPAAQPEADGDGAGAEVPPQATDETPETPSQTQPETETEPEPEANAAPQAPMVTTTEVGDGTASGMVSGSDNDAQAMITSETHPDTPPSHTGAPEQETAPDAPLSDAGLSPQNDPSAAPQTSAIATEMTPSAVEEGSGQSAAEPDAQTPPTTTPEAPAPEVAQNPDASPIAPDAPPSAGAAIEPQPQTPAETETAQVVPPSIRVPVPEIRNLAPNVRTNRLPSIGDTQEDAAQPVENAGSSVPRGALEAFSVAFENPTAKPLFSIVLIDDPAKPLSDDMLAQLSFPVTFAIDAGEEGAAQAAKRYRTAGFEVMLMTNLPIGAAPSDVEVAFAAYKRAVPEAVAVLDAGQNGFLTDRVVAAQVAKILAADGSGLITPSKGLNTVQKIAIRENVPAALIFRELDKAGEQPAVIRRYLNRAAFRAAQEGQVIMLGHTRAETIEALMTWAIEDRAASVALAPVSAVLKGL